MSSRVLSRTWRVQVGLIVCLLAGPAGAWGASQGGGVSAFLYKATNGHFGQGRGGQRRLKVKPPKKELAKIIKAIADPSKSLAATAALKAHLATITSLSPGEALGIEGAFRKAANQLKTKISQSGEVPRTVHAEALRKVISTWKEAGPKETGNGIEGEKQALVEQLTDKVTAWSKHLSPTDARGAVGEYTSARGKEALFSFKNGDLTLLREANEQMALSDPFAKKTVPKGILDVVELVLDNAGLSKHVSQEHKKIRETYASLHKKTVGAAFEATLSGLKTQMAELSNAPRLERELDIGSLNPGIDALVAFVADSENNKAEIIAATTNLTATLGGVADVFHQAALLHVDAKGLNKLVSLHRGLQAPQERAGGTPRSIAEERVHTVGKTVAAFEKQIIKAHELKVADSKNERASEGWLENSQDAFDTYRNILTNASRLSTTDDSIHWREVDDRGDQVTLGDVSGSGASPLELARRYNMLMVKKRANTEGEARAEAFKQVKEELDDMTAARGRGGDPLGVSAGGLLTHLKGIQAAAETAGQPTGVARLTRRTRENLSAQAEETILAVVDDARFEHPAVVAAFAAYDRLSDETDVTFGRKKQGKAADSSEDQLLRNKKQAVEKIVKDKARRADFDVPVEQNDELSGWASRLKAIAGLETGSAAAQVWVDRVLREGAELAEQDYDKAKEGPLNKVLDSAKDLGRWNWFLSINFEKFNNIIDTASTDIHEPTRLRGIGGTGKTLLTGKDYALVAELEIQPQLDALLRHPQPWKKLGRIKKLVEGLELLVKKQANAEDPAWLVDRSDESHGTIREQLLKVAELTAEEAADGASLEQFRSHKDPQTGVVSHKGGLMRVAELYDQATTGSKEAGKGSLVKAMAAERRAAVESFADAQFEVVSRALENKHPTDMKHNRKLLVEVETALSEVKLALALVKDAGDTPYGLKVQNYPKNFPSVTADLAKNLDITTVLKMDPAKDLRESPDAPQDE